MCTQFLCAAVNGIFILSTKLNDGLMPIDMLVKDNITYPYCIQMKETLLGNPKQSESLNFKLQTLRVSRRYCLMLGSRTTQHCNNILPTLTYFQKYVTYLHLVPHSCDGSRTDKCLEVDWCRRCHLEQH